MNKRGLSNVMISIIIIVSSFFIVMGLIFVSQKNIFGEKVEDLSLESLGLDVEIQNAKIEGNNIAIDVKRNMGKGDLTGIKFIFSDGEITEVKERTVSLKELESRVFDFTLDKLDVSKVKSISVAPIFKTESGKEKIGKIVDIYHVEPGENRVEAEVTGPVCGNLILETGEQCEDGNTNDGDGCSSTCQTEEKLKEELGCVFTNAYWSANKLVENKIATLIVEGSDCNGQLVNFQILEYNVLLKDDPVNIKPKPRTFIGNIAKTTWVVEYQDDGVIDPEYYFIATLNSNSTINIKTVKSNNDLLQVAPFVKPEEIKDEPEIESPVCGNLILESGEQCDDGNTNNGDGCSSNCKVEKIIPVGKNKWHPGHYIKTQGNHADSDQTDYYNGVLRTINNKVEDDTEVLGAFVAFGWGAIETSQGVYDFSQIYTVLNNLEAKGKYLILEIPYKSFSNDVAYLAPNYLSSQIYQTTRKETNIVEVWESANMDRYIAMWEAVAVEFDGHPNVEMVTWSESATSLQGDSPGSYSRQVFAIQLKRLYVAQAVAWEETNVVAMINFLRGELGGTNGLVETVYQNNIGRSGPDLRKGGAFIVMRGECKDSDCGIRDYRGTIPHMSIWSHSSATEGNGDTDTPSDALSWALSQGITHIAWVSSEKGEDSWTNILAAIRNTSSPDIGDATCPSQYTANLDGCQ